MVTLVENIPLTDDDWAVDPAILVSVLSLEQYWECYWEDNAPYYVQTIERDMDDIMGSNTAWGSPSEGNETELGYDVLQERN